MGALKIEKPARASTLAKARAMHQRDPYDVGKTLILSDLLEAKGFAKKATDLWLALLEHDPECNSARLNLATLLFRHREFHAAYAHFVRIDRSSGFAAQAHNGAGACCFELKSFDLAIGHYSEAIKLNNRGASTYENLAFALVAIEKFTEAAECFNLAYTVSGRDSSILSAGADLLLKNNAVEDAIALYREYLALVPDNAQAFSNLGAAYRANGQFEAAEQTFVQAVKLDQTNPVFLYNLSTITKSPALQKLTSGVTYQDESAHQRACYHFAMAKDFDLLEEYETAFHHFEKGNDALHSTAPSNGVINPLNLDLGQTQETVADCPTPIFIVGMPRSGTTLVERLLSSHSLIAAGGERNWLQAALQHALVDQDGLPDARAFDIAKRYSANIPKSLKETPYFTDKMPLNFRYVKEAALAFPTAKFVHVHRDPRAVAWSNYRTYFTIGGADLSYSTNRKSIAEFMQNYRQEVASWNCLPEGRIVHLDYEMLVLEPEKETAQLIAALGLPEKEASTKEQRVPVPIRTASAQQARRAVYKDSSLSWKNYQSFAADWFENISDLRRYGNHHVPIKMPKPSALKA
ncbi:sulfotransferase [Planktotalea sp.]|uniref:tetratricopeptide repeat-containing sulfotransferase family protein n=1 Tax=Planktotalea sp. TaxID=2029877 RepID=UPI0032989722